MSIRVPEVSAGDAFVLEKVPDGNTGGSRYLRVQSGYFFEGVGIGDMRTFVRFPGKWIDRDRIPRRNVKILSATVSLYGFIWMGHDRVPRDFAIHRVLEDWKEHEVTWNTQPSFVAEPTSIFRTGPLRGWWRWDVTPDLNHILNDDWVSWCIKDDREGGGPHPEAFWHIVFFGRERDLKRGRKVPILQLTYMYISNIHGTVIDKETRSPLEGVEITIDGISMISDTKGKFHFLEIEAKKYEIIATKENYKRHRDEIDVSEPGDYELLIEMEPASNLFGIVIDHWTKEPIGRASIMVDDRETISALDGRFHFLDLDPMVYDITVMKAEYRTFRDEIDLSTPGDHHITIELKELITLPEKLIPPAALLGAVFGGAYLWRR